MLGTVFGIMVSAIGFFGTIVSIITIFVAVRESDKIILSRHAMVCLLACLAILCIGVAILYNAFSSGTADAFPGGGHDESTSDTNSDMNGSEPGSDLEDTEPNPGGPEEGDGIVSGGAGDAEEETVPSPGVQPEVADTILLDIVCENYSEFSDYYIEVIQEDGVLYAFYDWWELPVEIPRAIDSFYISVYHLETDECLFESDLYDVNDIGDGLTAYFHCPDIYLLSASFFTLDVYCDDDPRFAEFYLSVWHPEMERTYRYEQSELPITLPALSGEYFLSVFSCDGEFLLYEDSFVGRTGEEKEIAFSLQEESNDGESFNLPEFNMDYVWFPYANLCVELLDGETYDSFGIEVSIGYAGTYECVTVCDYQYDPVWIQIEPLQEYEVLAIYGDSIIASEEIYLVGLLDPNAFQTVQIQLP